ncbi:MAG: histidine phosphatase family protein [Prevotella sp.]|nr:histidine phosphatase family protein [Prevotella sp.]
MTKLYLIRHGQTVDNVNQIMQGQTQGELTAEGEEQARQLRDRLLQKHFDAFVSSDLKRSVDTCRIIAEPFGMEVVQTPLLRERDWGGFTGRFIPELKGEVWPDDIETLEELLARAQQFLDFIRQQYPGKTVLAVGHGIINKAIQAVFYKKAMRDVPRMANAEIRILDLF